jgi:hypothetical protein
VARWFSNDAVNAANGHIDAPYGVVATSNGADCPTHLLHSATCSPSFALSCSASARVLLLGNYVLEKIKS